MTPEKQGRFCGACQKEVIDFSTLSAQQIVQVMTSKSNEMVCGRFKQSQLDQTYSLGRIPHHWNVDLRAVVLGLALTTFIPEYGMSQGNITPVEQIDTNEVVPMIMGDIAPYFDHTGEKKVVGKITSEDKMAYNAILVSLYDASGKLLKTVHPNAKGEYSFDLVWSLNPAYVQISAPFIATAMRYFENERDLSNVNFYVFNEREMIKGKVQIAE